MSNLSKQRQLAIANRHIAEAQARIAQQAQAVRQLKADGRDTTAAQDRLGVLRQSLDATKAHREQIIASCRARQTEGQAAHGSASFPGPKNTQQSACRLCRLSSGRVAGRLLVLLGLRRRLAGVLGILGYGWAAPQGWSWRSNAAGGARFRRTTPDPVSPARLFCKERLIAS